MIEHLHYLGSRLRRSAAFRPFNGLWTRVAPVWQRLFLSIAGRRGLPTSINGDVFRLAPSVGSRYGRHVPRAYEPIFYDAFVHAIQPGMLVFDIGAHVGLFTLAAAKRVGPGRVYAFEPSRASADVLDEHLRLNHWQDRASVVRAVVSDRDGTRGFFAAGATTAASLDRRNAEFPLNRERLAEPLAEVIVPSVTLDAFCDREQRLGPKRPPDVVKIDVEGAECLVLRGARRVLTEARPVVLCEVHPVQMRNCGSSVEELEALVRELGYRMDRLDPPNDAGAFHVRMTRS